MRTLILAALAASVAATPALAQEADFTGPRAEVIVGYDSISNGATDESHGGLLYGGAIGYDAQIGRFVLGIEGEVTGATTDAGRANLVTGSMADKSSAGRDLYAGVRLGAVLAPRTLVYAKGGYTNLRIANAYQVTIPIVGFDPDEELDGWRIGAGIEQRLGGRFYVKGEYRFSRYDETRGASAIEADRHQFVTGFGVRF